MRILWLSAVSSLICAHSVLKIQYRSLIQSENFDNVHTSWVKLSNFSISKPYAGNPAEWARCAIKNSKYNCHNSCARNVIKIYSTLRTLKFHLHGFVHIMSSMLQSIRNIIVTIFTQTLVSYIASYERENTQPSLSFNYRFNLLITAENGTQHDMKVTS